MFNKKNNHHKRVVTLQTLACDENSCITEVIRFAISVFIELDKPDVVSWLKKEQQGYAEEDGLPSYRQVPFYIGYKPIGIVPMGYGKLAQYNSYTPVPGLESCSDSFRNPISYIQHTVKNKEPLHFAIDPEFIRNIEINLGFNHQCEFRKIIPIESVYVIINSIKDAIVEATSELKSMGILGDDWEFTKDDVDKVSTKQFGFFNNIRMDK